MDPEGAMGCCESHLNEYEMESIESLTVRRLLNELEARVDNLHNVIAAKQAGDEGEVDATAPTNGGLGLASSEGVITTSAAERMDANDKYAQPSTHQDHGMQSYQAADANAPKRADYPLTEEVRAEFQEARSKRFLEKTGHDDPLATGGGKHSTSEAPF